MTMPQTSELAGGSDSVEGAERRSSVLAQGAAAIRTRSRSVSLETILVVVGGLLVPIGVGAIILGWYGVAHTSYTFEQNSYIVSGGLLGLSLVFIGGFAYFGSWVTRQIRTASHEHGQTMRVLERLAEDNRAALAATEAMARLLASHLSAPDPVRPYAPGTNGAESRSGRWATVTTTATLVATKRGTLVHRPDCPIVAAKSDLKAVGAGEPGYEPCRICGPAVG